MSAAAEKRPDGLDRFAYLAAPRPSAYFFYEGCYWLSLMTTILGFGLRIRGTRHVPRRGPVLFVANHQSFLDPVLVGLAVRRHICYLARKSLFRNPVFAWLIRMLNAVPLDIDGVGIEGLRTALHLLEAGQPVIVFPEGKRTPDGAVHPLQPGVVLLIKRARVPVVPLGLAGAFEAWSRRQPLPKPAPLFLPASERSLAVVVGRPIFPDRIAALPREQILAALFQELQRLHGQAERLRRKPK